jgi:lysophospholipase L1-like esterase
MKVFINISLITTAILLSGSVSANGLDWSVKNPFRFLYPQEEHNQFSIPAGKSALDFIQDRMSKRNRDFLPPFDETYWIKDIEAQRRLPEEYIFPSNNLVEAKLKRFDSGQCRWKYQEQVLVNNCSEGFEFKAITQFGKGSPLLSVEVISSGEIISEEVVVRDRLILGLGDSYASGEGNPDWPTLISSKGTQSLAENNSKVNTTGRWMKHEDLWVEKEAEWLDRQCHRSFFSQHIMASLKLAGNNPHETITIVPLACSGAEILDGLLIPQKYPPGGGKFVKESQINFAVKHLCRDGSIRVVKKAFYRGYTGTNKRKLELQGIYRCDGELRKPDAIFLSVGGNDVGFAPSIAWATIPSGYRHPGGLLAVNITNKTIKPVCPKYTGQNLCNQNKPVGQDRIKYWLPDYYLWLSEQLFQTGLVEQSNNVYLTAYPNPTFIEDGTTLCGVDRSTDLNEQARTKLPRAFWTQRWDLGITQSEMHDLNVGLIKPLYYEMKRSAELYGWTFIDSYLDELLDKGICSGYVRNEKTIPLYPHIRQGVWYPRDPASIWAYDIDKPYWFRNTNDSMLIEADHTNSDMNGAYHPDFRVHALIADHLAAKVRASWSNDRLNLNGQQ